MATDDPVAALEAADEAYRDAVDAVAAVGEDDLERVAAAYREFTDLLDRYEDTATGSGRQEFQSYVEFEGRLAEFEDGLDEDLPERGAFEEAADRLDRRRLEERDFERARGALAPVEELVDRLEARAAALERYREARRDVERRLAEIESELDDVADVLAFADVDFDAPVDDLRDPIDAYNEAVSDAFAGFKRSESARAVLGFVADTEAYPLVPFRPPPEGLCEYLEANEIGAEPIPTLLEYAGFSRSKAGHYVDDPGTFMVEVGGNRTYLERLDAEPLTIGWPPPPAAELRWRARELVAVVDRFAPAGVIERLNAVRDLAREPDRYGRLRDVARARSDLDDETRERLRSGAVERERERLREERERLRAALEEYPDR